MQEETKDDEEIDVGNANRVFEYINNIDKNEGKYITGYMCSPDDAVSNFMMARELTLGKAGQPKEKETGAVAFHIVQSFPEGLDISDEEVHQCGLELVERLKVHQAVISSHVHPVKDEETQELRGKCKHNHILINAYIHPAMYDPEKSKAIKYNDCKETYAQLRIWNDEIAIDHGLPIIRNPDEERTYSWLETGDANKGLSWKERMRMDIESARRLSSNWKEFLSVMEKAGYKIKEGAHTTFIAPDGTHKARGGTLGKQYTKENMELFWSVRSYSQKAVEEAERDNASTPLTRLISNAEEPIFVGIPLGIQGQEKRSIYFKPISEVTTDREALESYFNPDELYDLYNEEHRPIAAATGAEIISSIEQLHRNGKDLGPDFSPDDEFDEDRNKKRYYTCYMFVNTRTKKPYRTSLYDQTGRRRSTLELLFILAMTILKKEDGLWNVDPVPSGYENQVLYADTNWKIQNMMDAMYTASSEGIETLAQLEARLNVAGAAYSRARSAYKKTTRAKEKMDTLNQAVVEYQKTKDLAEKLLEMPDGQEKLDQQAKHKDVIDRYKAAKAVMYRFRVTEDAQVEDFLMRYEKITEDIKELEERLDETKEEYRKLKKLSYNAALAENAQYCYGPAYTYEQAYSQVELAQRQEQTEAEKRRLDEQIEQSRQEEIQERPEKEAEMKK